MIRAVLVALVLAGCARQAPVVPVALHSCPEAAAAPAAPPRVRTAAQLAQFAVALELAREQTRDALVECDRRRALAVGMIGP